MRTDQQGLGRMYDVDPYKFTPPDGWEIVKGEDPDRFKKIDNHNKSGELTTGSQYVHFEQGLPYCLRKV